MDEATLLDRIDRILHKLRIPPRTSQVFVFGIGADGNTATIRLWTKEECQIVGRRLRKLGFHEITIRAEGYGYVMTADYHSSCALQQL